MAKKPTKKTKPQKIFNVVEFRRILKTTGIKQSFIAEEIEVSRITIGNWKAGKGEPTIVHLNNLARVLGVDIKVLMKK